MPYEYLLVRSGEGLVVHLAEARAATTLCSRPVSTLELRVSFEMSGCHICAKTAVKNGTERQRDVDGEIVSLVGFKSWAGS